MSADDSFQCANCGTVASEDIPLGWGHKVIFFFISGTVLTGKVCKKCGENAKLVLMIVTPFVVAGILILGFLAFFR